MQYNDVTANPIWRTAAILTDYFRKREPYTTECQ